MQRLIDCRRCSSAIALALGFAFGAPVLRAQATPATNGALQPGVHELEINGVRLWYRVAGDSASKLPVLVFLHGGPGYNSYSFSVLEGQRLEGALRLVYLDQRGSGRSERPRSNDYALSTLVEDLEGLRRSFGVSRIAVMGHSFGGVLALEYAARYPERVSHLILISTPADVPASCIVRKAQLLERHPEVRAKADSPGTAVGSDCELEFRLLRGPAHDAFSDAIMFPDSLVRKRQDSVDAASGLRNTGELGSALMRKGLLMYRFATPERLSMPVLVIAGAKDGSVGVVPQETFAKSVRGARFIAYENAGHFLYLDAPDRFARDVIAFLSK